MPDKTLSLHSHSVYSQRDAIIKIDKAAAKIKAAGGTHYALSDHGTIQGWLALRDACAKNKLTAVYGCELYVNDQLPGLMEVLKIREAATTKSKAADTIRGIQQHVLPLMTNRQSMYLMRDLDSPKDLAITSKQLFSRIAFGYQHLVAVAISAEGRRNLIRLVNRGWTAGYYYKPQVTTADCLELAEGIVWTTACLGGPIARRLAFDPSGEEARDYLKRWEPLKSRFHLEVQPLHLLHQRRYNAKLIELSDATGFPLILSQDNHHLDEDEWLPHPGLMLGPKDRTIQELGGGYSHNSREMQVSDPKKALGVQTTWETQEIVERDGIDLVRHAGHHYGDVRMHWRTNDEVRKQCETTNPELLPVLDRCFAVTDRFAETIPEIKWDHKFHLQHHEGAREKILRLCAERLKAMDLWPRPKASGSMAGVQVYEGDGVMTGDPEQELFERQQRYLAWLSKEDKVITACGFWDYIMTLYQWTKAVQDEGIPIGYARGSVGGCLVMFLLNIIRVDPVKYGLYFERFLNPARLGLDPTTLVKVKEMASCPDVDLDFSSINRDRVIQIAVELFGRERVVPVGTVGEAKLRTALADLCRVVGITQAEYMPASKELPDDATDPITFEKAMEVPAFRDFVNKHPVVRRFLPSLVGVVRSTGQHAGGVCIADVAIAMETPVVRAGSKEGGNIVTGFGESGAERALESVGYVKFDALATDTVDHVSLCARAWYKQHLDAGGAPLVKEGERFLYPEQIPEFTENDPEVMKAIFYSGNTDGIFQMEESIGKDMCRLIKPDTINELADISTMIRPGCLQAPYQEYKVDEDASLKLITGVGLHFEYAARKFRGSINPPPSLPAEVLEVIKPTHYCCIYQEQMMFLIQVVTGGKMSLGEGDIYRRACEHAGKGKQEAKDTLARMEGEMRAMSPYPSSTVDRVTTLIKGGANYAFNKSHSLSYSLFSYAQAWFKHRFPHIFYASHVSLLAAKNKLDKAHKIINNARAQDITIKPPHIQHSARDATWSADGRTIYLPFTVMKGVKDATATALTRIGAKVKTLEEVLVACVADPDVKKNHLVSMARVGALDDLGYPRIKALAMVNYVCACTTGKSSVEAILAKCKDASEFIVAGDDE